VSSHACEDILQVLHHEKSAKEFFEFCVTYNRQYESHEEIRLRFKIFLDNLERIDQLNSRGRATFGITKFADLTEDEFRDRHTGLKARDEKYLNVPNIKVTSEIVTPTSVLDVPPEWDWRTMGAVTPIKNQADCGSCWAFSTIANLEGAWVVQGNHSLVSLSEMNVMLCSPSDSACGGGWPAWAMSDLLKAPYNGGIETEAAWPYNLTYIENDTCTYNASDVGATYNGLHIYCNESTNMCSEDSMASYLIATGPLSAALNAGSMQLYKGGIDDPQGCLGGMFLDHAVAIVGYGASSNGTDYWIIKNSWGADWGENGYYRLIRGTGACGINQVITTVLVN